ncbi:MAG TPA: hypothetical protein VMW34_12285 [Anaerolineales bacterium]|nr:hypothetical protein [Anaerolineales bacterium]
MINSFLSYFNASQALIPVKFNTGALKAITPRMLWALGILTVVFTYVNMSQISPNDFWWHMAVGREIIATGQIPTVDIYSYTMAGQPYLSYQIFWLMDVWLYWWYSLGGAELILFVQSLIITCTYLIITLLCWKKARKWGVAAFCLLFAIVLGIYAWSVRPQAISFLIGALFLYTIHSYRHRPNPLLLAVFPVGMLVWVNSHGSFPIGLLLVGIWLGDKFWQTYLARWRGERKSQRTFITSGVVLLVATTICFLNPRGVGIIRYIISMGSNPTVQNTVPEWLPPNITSPIGPFFFAGILFCIVVLVISPRRVSFYQLATFVAFTALGLWTTRDVVWFGLVMAPILAVHLSSIGDNLPQRRERPEPSRLTSLVNFGLLNLLLVLALLSLPWFRSGIPVRGDYRSLITRDTPTEAVKFLMDEQPEGRVFNDMAFGSYMIWAAQPKYQVFADPRIELFPQDIWDDYQVISQTAPGWEGKLAQYQVRTLILNPQAQGALAEKAAQSGDWQLIHQDETAQIYQRTQ